MKTVGMRRLLDTQGYTVLYTDAKQEAICGLAEQVGVQLGARTIGVKLLEGRGSLEMLSRHTESITQVDSQRLRYFALGCLVASRVGGETRLYDARRAATLIRQECPSITGVRIRYHSTVYSDQEAVHPVIRTDAKYGAVLVYRAQASTNTILNGLPEGVDEAYFYSLIEHTLDRCLISVHQWAPGQLLVVNNRLVLHDRLPYQGLRRLLRFRYDDPHFKTILIEG